MKEIIAIIRPGKWQKTKEILQEEGFTAFTAVMVYGRGKEKGLHYLTSGGQAGISYLPKRMVIIIVESERVEPLVKLLIETNSTGEIGDGKIFVCAIENTTSIRTVNEAPVSEEALM